MSSNSGITKLDHFHHLAILCVENWPTRIGFDQMFVMRRHELSDSHWQKIEPLLSKGAGRPSSKGDRNFINAVHWIAKTGAPWRDLPERFGPWSTIHNRFLRWSMKERWQEIFNALAITDDEVGGLMDGTVVRAHQDSSGGLGGQKKTA